MNRDRLEQRVTKVYAFDDPVTIGFPGARALVRTFRQTWQLKDGKPVGELICAITTGGLGERSAIQIRCPFRPGSDGGTRAAAVLDGRKDWVPIPGRGR